MPPKRKAAAEPAAESKRSTRASTSSSSANPSKPSTSGAAAAPKKDKAAPKKKTAASPKGKRKATVLELSDGSSNSEAEMVAPPPVKKAKAPVKAASKKAPAPKQDKKQPKPSPARVRKDEATFSTVVVLSSDGPDGDHSDTGRASTSTTPIPEVKPLPKAVKAMPKKPVSWAQGLKDWFAQYAEEDEPGKMGGEGIEKLFEDMKLPMEGVLPFLLAFKLNAKPGTFGSFLFSDFERTFEVSRINTSAGLKTHLLAAEKALYPVEPMPGTRAPSEAEFKTFYLYLFQFMRNAEMGQKSLDGQMAAAVWSAVLSPRYPIAKEIVDYTTGLGTNFKAVSADVWSQLLEFLQTVGDDFAGYTEDDSWPAIFDAFAEHRKEQRA